MFRFLVFVISTFSLSLAYGQSAGDVATNITHVTDGVSGILYVIAYVTAFAFLLTGLVKLKKHRENPMQIHLSMVFVDFFVAFCIFFLPYFAQHSNEFIFGIKGPHDPAHPNLPDYNIPKEPPGVEQLIDKPGYNPGQVSE